MSRPTGVKAGRRGSSSQPTVRAGQILIWPGHAIYLGLLLENETHAHHAIQISIALEAALSLQAPPRRWSTYRAVATAPDQLHRIRCRGPIAQIYIDSESTAGLALRERIGDRGVLSIRGDALGSCPAVLRSWSNEEVDEHRLVEAIDDLTPARFSSPKLIDPRIQHALSIASAVRGRHLPLDVLADQVALSPSRLAALFRRDIGIPMRRYLLWLRLIDAIKAVSDGMTLTEAGYDAGFADSAHLSRTFRGMFGMPPSALRSEHIKIHNVTEELPASS